MMMTMTMLRRLGWRSTKPTHEMVIEKKLYESCDIYQCEICLDNHDTKSVVITCCGHSFGTECLSGGEIRVLSITAIRLVVLRVGSPTNVLCYTRVRRVKM
jgi:hypothetical protein